MDALERAQRILDEVTARVAADLPPDTELFDVHTHLGDDIDGMRGRPDELLAMLDTVGVRGAFTFCLDEPDRVLRRRLHAAVRKVTTDTEAFGFNTAIASLMELLNETQRQRAAMAAPSAAYAGVAWTFCRLLAPFAPHFADELGARLGVVSMKTGGFFGSSWPAFDPAMLVDDEIEMPVQIQGKIKARLMVPAKADAAAIEALALAHADVVAAIAGRPVKKVVVVPGRMVNIVV